MQLPRVRAVPAGFDGVLAWSRRRAVYLVLGAALVVGLALRLHGLNWDQGFMFHPDERAILMKVEGGVSLPTPVNLDQLLDPKTSPLNPHWFPYGSMPLYLLKLVAHLLSFVKQSYASHDLRLVGRTISALFDTGTIFLVFLIGRRLYDRRVGVLAAVFASLAVIGIQLSHFFAVDVILAFFITLAVYFCADMGGYRHRILPKWLLVGVALGLALATKVSMAPILVTAAVCFALDAFRNGNGEQRADSGERVARSVLGFLLCLVVAGVVFFLAAPFAVLDRDAFWASVTEQSEMVRRIRDYPYTRQYIDTPAYLYPIVQLGRWGLGPALGIVAWSGLAFSSLSALFRRHRGDILLLSWVLPYFALTGSFEVKFLRYLLPIVPVLCLMGARMLFSLRDFAPYVWSKGRFLANVAIGVVVAATAFYALAYMNVYSNKHTAVRMSEWINANVPKGAMILKEHWEEGIPNLGAYRSGDLNLYEDDNGNKLNHIVGQLQTADYVVFYSNRLYGTIPRLPDRYPLTSRYYDLLFEGKLGYELVRTETAYASLLGVSFAEDTFGRPRLTPPGPLAEFKPSPVTIDGGFADESFSVYDHPKVMLFKKVKPIGDRELRSLFADISLNRPPPGLSTKPGLLFSEAEAKANQEGGTWSDIFDRNGIANRLPALSWLIMVEIISLAAFPIGALLFRRLADRGFLLTKILGILLVAYLSWLLAATRLLPFSRLTIFFSLVLVAAFSTYLFVRFREDIQSFVRTRWRLLVGLEALFLVAFLGFYIIRLANPDLWHAWRGGEKPMDFAYLNAVIKTTYFPPYDPWLSGGYLNYYYFGQVIVATLTKLIGIVPAVAYNLAVPLLFALTLGGAFSIGYNLRLATKGWGNPATWRWSALVCGLMAAAMVAVLGNLDGILQLVDGLAKAGNFNFQSTIPGLAGVINAAVGLWRALVDHQSLPAFDFWRSSRMMPGTINITEFPYFTFLFADLHAHLIALPFTVLAIGLALNLALPWHGAGAESGASRVAPSGAGGNGAPLLLPKYAGRLPGTLSWVLNWLSANLPLPRLFPVLGLALALGALRIINSWDFPTYLLLSAAAIFIGEYAQRRRLGLGTVVWTLVKVGLVFYLSSFLYRPFHDTYELFYTGIESSKEKTIIWQYLAVHGLFLFAVISYLVFEVHRHFRRSGFLRTVLLALRHWEDLPRAIALHRRLVKKPDSTGALVAYGVIAMLLVVAVLVWAKLYLIALLFVILALLAPPVAGELVKREAGMSPRLFILTMVGLAVALGIGVDFITIKGDINRMNTVFKFYLQAWVLFGLASAYGLGTLLSDWLGARSGLEKGDAKRGKALSLTPSHSDGRGDMLRRRREGLESPLPPQWEKVRVRAPILHASAKRMGSGRMVWLAVLVVLLVATAIYPLAATRVRVQDRFQPLSPTDDGMAFMKGSIYSDEKGKVDLSYDYEAITWMQNNVKGSPVIVEAYTPLYRWGSRVSIYTGLPTIIGWDWHQTQQRMPYRWMIEARMKDVRDIYLNTDPKVALDLLSKYGVKYVYVGELERLYFGGPGLAKFDQMSDLKLIHQNQAVKIYTVSQN